MDAILDSGEDLIVHHPKMMHGMFWLVANDRKLNFVENA